VEPIGRTVDGSNVKLATFAKAMEALAVDAQKRRKDYDVFYAELKGYKDNFLEVAQRPLYMDLLLLFDGIERVQRSVEDAPDTIPKHEVKGVISGIKDELLEILYRRDIKPIVDHPTKLDVTLQKPVRRI